MALQGRETSTGSPEYDDGVLHHFRTASDVLSLDLRRIWNKVKAMSFIRIEDNDAFYYFGVQKSGDLTLKPCVVDSTPQHTPDWTNQNESDPGFAEVSGLGAQTTPAEYGSGGEPVGESCETTFVAPPFWQPAAIDDFFG